MTDLSDLAELSHGLERVAITLAEEGEDLRLIAHELVAVASGQREVVAIALSYLLRQQALADDPDEKVLTTAIDAMVLAMRRSA